MTLFNVEDFLIWIISVMVNAIKAEHISQALGFRHFVCNESGMNYTVTRWTDDSSSSEPNVTHASSLSPIWLQI